MIHKLRNNVPITKEELNSIENMLFTEDLAGTKEQLIEQYGEKPLGAFIRSVTDFLNMYFEKPFKSIKDCNGDGYPSYEEFYKGCN